ncbi:hypothetical protein KIN20_035589 [Parelaphostrongylus tenuis]|uniref:Uncharacterized protein n=1 Tax=Parelaphostrongylus tenuis TaxID=148309 RepID=A0AAD5RBQ3_PARTN|nr:hypothetical protein KIN20_035589 [Parelaphostrongylus tenuis]
MVRVGCGARLDGGTRNCIPRESLHQGGPPCCQCCSGTIGGLCFAQHSSRFGTKKEHNASTDAPKLTSTANNSYGQE